MQIRLNRGQDHRHGQNRMFRNIIAILYLISYFMRPGKRRCLSFLPGAFYGRGVGAFSKDPWDLLLKTTLYICFTKPSLILFKFEFHLNEIPLYPITNRKPNIYNRGTRRSTPKTNWTNIKKKRFSSDSAFT